MDNQQPTKRRIIKHIKTQQVAQVGDKIAKKLVETGDYVYVPKKLARKTLNYMARQEEDKRRRLNHDIANAKRHEEIKKKEEEYIAEFHRKAKEYEESKKFKEVEEVSQEALVGLEDAKQREEDRVKIRVQKIFKQWKT